MVSHKFHAKWDDLPATEVLIYVVTLQLPKRETTPQGPPAEDSGLGAIGGWHFCMPLEPSAVGFSISR